MGGLAMMTAPLPDHELDDLLHTYEHLEVPEGQRAELIGGEIVISPTPTTFHNWIYSLLHRQLDRGTPDDWYVTNTTTVHLPATDEMYVPDLLVCGSDALRSTQDWRIPADDVLLAAEITSRSTARRDRGDKIRGYAGSRVPVSLLVDPLDGDGWTTVYSEPGGEGRYQSEHRVPFGGKLSLPEPFGLTLDTSAFRRS